MATTRFRTLWVTDPHLEFLTDDASTRAQFLQELRQEPADAIQITGDITNAANLKTELERLAQLDGPVYFILGNHDFYGGTITGSSDIAKKVAKDYRERLIYLDDTWIVRLTNTATLTGVNGFADSLAGKGSKTKARINDFFHIQNFASLQNDSGRFNLMRTLAENATEKARKEVTRGSPGLESRRYRHSRTAIYREFFSRG